jgi:hypothetical protein
VQVRRDDRHIGDGDVRYFVAVVADGGPSLHPFPVPGLILPGQPVTLKVGLHYPDGTTPTDAAVDVTVSGPAESMLDLVARHGLIAGGGGADPVSDTTATLQALAAANGGTLPLANFEATYPLFDDGEHDDGAMEPDGIFASEPLSFATFEGTYTFHARARYGSGCRSTREAMWSMTVGLQDDPYHTEVKPGSTAPHQRS